MKKNAILVDMSVTEKWDFKVALEERTHENWECEMCISNQYSGSKLKILIRYIIYFVFPFSIFLHRKQYKRIFAWQQFYGLVLAFYCALFHVKNAPEIYVMTFIYKPKRINLYNKWISYIVKSGYIRKIIVLSNSERDYYAKLFDVAPELFYCTHIGVPDISDTITRRPNNNKFYLSVGRSNRDYKFLRDSWDPEWGRLFVVSDSYKEQHKEGIICLNNCFGKDYHQILADCYAQIIPLDDVNISSGSLSFLTAMMLSKPTIVTENATVYDYITDKQDGMIIKKTKEGLHRAIEYLNDEKNYQEICKQARSTYANNFSEYALGCDIGTLIEKLKR